MENEAIIIDTPEGIEHFRMSALISALNIEVRTGMKMSRGSVLAIAKNDYGCKSRTKEKALDEMKQKYFNKYGIEYGVKK